MRSFREGELVTVVGDDGAAEGIVVHVTSLVKIEVAVHDAEHGPVFSSVHPKVLRERDSAGEHDEALRRAIRGGPGGGHGRRGHAHASGHRTTGK
jgi:hypothetical protein